MIDESVQRAVSFVNNTGNGNNIYTNLVPPRIFPFGQ